MLKLLPLVAMQALAKSSEILGGHKLYLVQLDDLLDVEPSDKYLSLESVLDQMSSDDSTDKEVMNLDDTMAETA